MAKPPPPPLGPDGQPVGPDALAPVFPMNLIEQEVSQERWIDIPEEIVDIYRLWRPSPLFRAINLEKKLDTLAKIYYKYEGVSPDGSHKPNTAVAQAYYNKKEGVKRITTETVAGQWGSALSFACQLFGVGCEVYMVRISFDQKPFRKAMMRVWDAECVASPSTETNAGRQILEKDPDTTGSLGIAISEAVELLAQKVRTGKIRISFSPAGKKPKPAVLQEREEVLRMAVIEGLAKLIADRQRHENRIEVRRLVQHVLLSRVVLVNFGGFDNLQRQTLVGLPHPEGSAARFSLVADHTAHAERSFQMRR